MSIRDKMRPLFRTLDGGLFSEKAGKADVGDAVSKLQAEGGTLMCWADPFYPDRVIPQKVLERSVEVIQQGVACHYTPPIGNADLKEVIAKKIERDNHIKVNPQRNIIINPGSDVGLYFAMTPFIEPGDEVLVHDPSYPSNFLDPQLLNGVVVKVPTYEEDNYRLRVEEYEKRLTPKTKMVLLSSPNNPTGRVFTREELTELSQFIIKHDLICVCDQAFEDTAFPGHEMVTMASLPGMWERTVTVCSCSKGMALSGYRVGYIFADDVIMDTMYATAVNIQGAANTMVQMAMIPASGDEIALVEVENSGDVQAVKDIFQARIDYQVGDGTSPGGAWYPAPTEMWRNESRIVSNGNFVMLVAHTGADAVVEQFNALFA